MPLDTRIALTGQPLQLESPLAQYSQLMSVANANTQNQLAQMQMSAAQRAAQEEEGLKNYLVGNPDLTTAEGQRGALKFGKAGQALVKTFADQAKDRAQTSLYGAQAEDLKYKAETQKLEKALSEISNFPDAPSALASIDTQVSRKIISPEQATQLKAQINAAPDFATWQRRTVTGMMAAKDRLDILEEQRYQAFTAKPAPAAPAAAAAAAPLPQAMATAPINDARAALIPVPAERSVNAIQLGDGNVVYRVDGKDVPFAVYADAVKGRNQAQGANAAIAATPGMAPAAAAPMAPVSAAAAAPMAPAAAPTPPAPAQPDMANALALKIQGLQDQRNQLEQFLRSPSAKLKYDDLGKQIDNLSKGFSVSAGGAYYQLGVGMVERAAAAPAPSDLARLIAERAQAVTSGASPQVLANYDSAIKKAATFAPPISVQTNVNAYTPASEEAQKDFIRSTRATYDTLKNAPGTLKNIEETIKLIPSAKGFMGPGGESLLDAASFLNNRLGTSINTKGVTDATELRSRLFQGIIENLRKLDANPTENQQNAMRVALGNIGTDPNALPAVLNSFADTVRSKVDMHNAEVESAVSRGVKFPYDPTIKLPTFAPPAPSKAATRPAGVPAEWTLHTDANGKKAYVSPDGKSFKEVP